MGLLNRLFNRKALERDAAIANEVLGVIRDVVASARNLKEAKDELVRRAQRGDLDRVLVKVASAKQIAQDFVNDGTVP